MDPEVDHDPGGTQQLRVQHAELGARIGEVAQFVHQALGVESPALAVT
jgi:hypothetical protein